MLQKNSNKINVGLLEGKVALVTGAGSGIGKAIALLFASEGATVVVSDVSVYAGDETATAIKINGGFAFFMEADISKPKDVQNLVDMTMKQYGMLHIAVNNAGITGPISPLGAYPIDGWDKVISTNLSGVFYGMRYQIPAILASGGGSIINIASALGKVATKAAGGYVAAKHGVIGLTETAALEYADQNIRINSIGPGYIQTPLLNALEDDARNALVGLHPMGRLGTPEEVAEVALWLASDKASFVTGSYYNVDGGYLAQ
ncbi:MAG: glucose 1-dehydrogenase [Saprospiraceae bacterium]|nr:glucose 1-dehydrogenase [Saprospiraceae bacterium]